MALSGCAFWAPGASPPAGGVADHAVYVLERGHHTDIGLDARELAGPLAAVRDAFPGARSVIFGFGDRTFVVVHRKWVGDWLRALVPGEGAMLVTGLRTSPREAFPNAPVVRIAVTQAELAGIVGFVSGSFALTDGRPVTIGQGPYPGSLFYASTHIYDLADTCNTWTAAALRAGGLPVPVRLTLFSGQALRAARLVGQTQ